MLVSLTLALLSAAPGHVSLLASDTSSRHLPARLLAQVNTPPPLPPSSLDEAPEARLADLKLELRELDSKLQLVGAEWPGGARALMAGGLLMMVGTVAIVFVGVANGLDYDLLAYGALGLLTAAVGVGLMGGGYALAVSAEKKERDALLRERKRLRAELRALEGRRDTYEQSRARLPRPTAFPLVALAF